MKIVFVVWLALVSVLGTIESALAKGVGNYLDAQELNHEIDSVIVYSDRAEVTRKSSIKVRKGRNWYIFKGLHPSLDKNSIRVKHNSGQRIKISQILIEQNYEYRELPKNVSKKIKQLKDNYMQLLSKRQSLKRERENLSFLNLIGFEAPFNKNSGINPFKEFVASSIGIGIAMDSVSKSILKLEPVISGLEVAISEQTKVIDFLKNSLGSLANKRNQVWLNNVYLLLESEVTRKSGIQISYNIKGAKWYPTYNIRAKLNRRTGDAKIKLITAGVVEQRTGEDWMDIAVTLSTLAPIPLLTPKLDRWVFAANREEFVDEENEMDNSNFGQKEKKDAARPQKSEIGKKRVGRRRMKKSKRLGRLEKSNMAELFEGEKDMEESIVMRPKSMASPSFRSRGKMRVDQARDLYPLNRIGEVYRDLNRTEKMFSEDSRKNRKRRRYVGKQNRVFKEISYRDSLLPAVQANGRNLEFVSPFRIDVESDKPAVTIPLYSKNYTGKISYLTIPKKDERVFIQAKTNNHSDRPILGGKAQVFVNGDLINKTTLSTIGEGGYFVIDMGVDQNVKTKRMVEKKSKKTGFVSKDLETTVYVEIEINNTHGFPIDIVLKDNFPQVNSDKLSVELQSVVPKATNKKHGLLVWKVEVPKNTVKKFSFTYKVKHPEDYIVSEFN